MTVTRDPNHPDFPHHTERGYARGCRSQCCSLVKSRAEKTRNLRRYHGIRTVIDAAPTTEHLARLLASHGDVNGSCIAKAAGVNARTVYQLASGKQQSLNVRTAQALLAVTVQAALAHAATVDATGPRRQVQSMMALGWTGSWIAEQLGHKHSGTGPPQFFYGHGASGSLTSRMTRDLADRISALAERVGDTPGPSSSTAKRSKARGWHVPGAYGDDGELNLRFVVGHPWTLADAHAATRIDILREILTGQATGAIATSLGIYNKQVERIFVRVRTAHGLSRTWDAHHHLNRFGGGLAAVTAILDDYDGGQDVILTAVMLGLLNPTDTRLPADHPSRAAYDLHGYAPSRAAQDLSAA